MVKTVRVQVSSTAPKNRVSKKETRFFYINFYSIQSSFKEELAMTTSPFQT